MQDKKIVTQIGSLPFSDVEQAIEYSLRCGIPFLPELFPRGESMLNLIKMPGNLSCLERFKQAADGLGLVKVQCIGPASLIFAKYDRDKAIQNINNHVSKIMDGLNAKKVILFLDEPSLDQFDGDYNELWDPIFKNFDVIRGVHTCGEANWDKMLASNIEIVSFDASLYDITSGFGYMMARGAGKRIAWGIKKADDVKDFQKGDLVTPPCGLGKEPVDSCEATLENLKRIARDVSGQLE